nr:unnamed protein product [Digitaria exilis]
MEMVAAPVVQRVAGKLGDIAWEKLQLLWNFKEDVQDIEGKMVDLQVTLSSADKHSRGTEDSPVQHWLKKYKFVAYDMEDALDELEADAMIWKHSPSKVKMFFSSINPLVVRITMSNKIRNIRVKLDKISEDQKKFTPLLLPTPTGQDNNKGQGETFIGERDEIEMVGREKEKNDILIKVSQKEGDQEISIIPVVGLGGMGKTTLAKSVYNDKQTLINFDVKAWVHVSEDFDLNKIVSDIICQVEGASPGNNVRLQYLKSRLDHILIDKIYLIVLDDLWEEGRSNLKDLMEMLQSGKKGSNVIVTTRNEKVASTLSNIHSSIFRTADPIKLEGMSIDECWSIMKPHNLGNAQLTELEDIGKEIAQLCHGVPLVAKALGYVMQKHCTRKEWLGIKNSNILDIKDGQKGILKGLLLSYYHMPPELKLCFMYCSMFPKGHDIDHDCLIQQWIALGFIQGTEEHLLQKIGTEYINELLGMSFLSILTSSTFGGAPPSEVWRRAHQYLSLIDILILSDMPGLRTLPEAARGFPSLRKLGIEDCDALDTLPEWLGDLTSLREIAIENCPKLSSLPESIQRLTDLNKLRIVKCPELSDKCRGEDKHKIAHIPEVEFELASVFVRFNRELVHGDDGTMLRTPLGSPGAACAGWDGARVLDERGPATPSPGKMAWHGIARTASVSLADMVKPVRSPVVRGALSWWPAARHMSDWHVGQTIGASVSLVLLLLPLHSGASEPAGQLPLVFRISKDADTSLYTFSINDDARGADEGRALAAEFMLV